VHEAAKLCEDLGHYVEETPPEIDQAALGNAIWVIVTAQTRCAPYLAGKTNVGEIAETLRVEVYDALKELSEYDPRKFEAANEEYLASIGAAKPEAVADGNRNGQKDD
jgi:hypothetical protein